MNALTGNKAALLIFHSIDMNALTGNAQNHAIRRKFNRLRRESGMWECGNEQMNWLIGIFSHSHIILFALAGGGCFSNIPRYWKSAGRLSIP
jgi:hypothetical protein